MDVLKDYAWDEKQYFGYCITCKFETGKFSNEDDCIQYINQRPIEAKLHEQIKELTKQLDQALIDLDHDREVVEELETQVFNLSSKTQNSRDAEKIEALKQWQREAVRIINRGCYNKESIPEYHEEAQALIKQAEENGINEVKELLKK